MSVKDVVFQYLVGEKKKEEDSCGIDGNQVIGPHDEYLLSIFIPIRTYCMIIAIVIMMPEFAWTCFVASEHILFTIPYNPDKWSCTTCTCYQRGIETATKVNS